MPFVIRFSWTDVANINGFIEEDPSLAGMTVDEIMMVTDGTVFNNAAQVRLGSDDNIVPYHMMILV